MNLARTRRGAAALHQRGFALIAILALAAMITAFLIAIGMNRSSTELANEREDRTMNALRQAKAALIAFAASDPPPAGYFQPGALPCPDKDNDDGISDCTGFTGASMIGRLPWVSMNIDNLRDSSGEELWYAVSQSFRKMVCTAPNTPTNCTTINSDTQGQFSVTGAISMNNVVAVVLAPGPVVQGQTRPTTLTAAAHNAPANYVESFNAGDGVHFSFTTNALPTDTFNDRLLVITQAELMAAVEPVVAARIERDIAPGVQGYVNNYGAYPFPAQFDPTQTSQSAYQGSTSQNRGLLPVTRSVLQWQPSSVSITHIAGGTGDDKIYSMDCGASTSSQISCQINYEIDDQNRPAIQIQATLRNAAISFPDVVQPTDTSKITMLKQDGSPADLTAFGQWTAAGSPQFVPTVSSLALLSGDATVTYQGRLQNGGFGSGTNGQITIIIALPDYLPFTNGANNANWFVGNQWYRQTYYVVAPGFLPGASPSGCNSVTGTPPCLTVNNLRPSYTVPNNKQAILVLAGMSLNGNSRPTINKPDYFESVNLTAANNPATFVFENRSGNPTSINDRVVVISPPPP